ncbi:ABC transporter substrate-binding protein [Leptolyngbya sp. AN02str]|uniref:ABC transporter substrate-binding protein n=1 Tax=Leptolyngbya sp. AN02str TaxID=3423363 RepID=UPI003D3209D9
MVYKVQVSSSFKLRVSGAIASFALLVASCTAPTATAPAPGSNAGPANSSATTVLRIGFTSADGSSLPIGPIGWAEQQGYLDDELQDVGIADVEFYGFDSGPGVNEAVAAGSVDLSMNGDTPAIVGKTNGLRTRLININTVDINVYLVPKKGGPETIADLAGGSIGVRVGAIPHRYVVGLLENAGLTGKVRIVNLTNSEGEAALARGDIDAYAATAALAYRLQSQGYKVIDEATNHDNLAGSNITAATEAFLTANPSFVEKWHEIIARATREIQAQPEAYYQFVSDVNKQPVDVSEFTSPISQYPSEPLPASGLENLKQTQQFLISEKIVKSDFSFDEWVYRP